MAAMTGITIKLPDAMLKRLREHAKASGRSVADLVRERLDASESPTVRSVHDLMSDHAGSLAGSSEPATNERRRFRRS